MKTAIKYFLVISFYLCSFQLHATHIVGGDVSVKRMNGNVFEVTLTFFRDCGPTSADYDQMVELGVYDKVTHSMQLSFILPLLTRDTLALGDTCFTPQNLCVEKGIFRGLVTIPDNAHGYYIAWQRCCRNHIILNIQNPGSSGMVFYSEIPDPALNDNSPVFGSYPRAYMCQNQINIQSFACSDMDGDSLVYSLVTPLIGFTNQFNVGQFPGAVVLTPGPYPGILWQPPYQANDMIGGVSPMTINPVSGIITSQPSNAGVYVFAVRVEEYRNGIKIGEIRRDIQYQVLSCPVTFVPLFSSPVSTSFSAPFGSATYSLTAGDSLSFDVIVTNGNLNDSVFLYGSSELFSMQTTGLYCSFRNDSGPGTVQQNFFLKTSCDAIRDAPYQLKLRGVKYTCYGLLITTVDVDIYVKPPPEGGMDSLVPNVFTPNDDGLNDFFQVKAVPNYCFDAFNLRIYNRWGIEVFETNDFLFQWDGKNKEAARLKEGVYYYVLDAAFKQSSFSKKGAIHLRR